MAFGNLTVDFKQLSRIPVRDRAALARSPQASMIFGNMTPSQIAALFPDYYKRALNPMAGQVSSFAAALSGSAAIGTGSSSGGGGRVSPSTAATAPTAPKRPTRPGFIEEIMRGVTPDEKVRTPLTPGTIVNIKETGKGYNVVEYADGKVERRSGTRNWRNNNPGNIEYGDYAKSLGAIGTDGRFAIFPTYEAGRKAKQDLLFESKNYKDKTISGAISRYAPPSENNTQAYINTVASSIGVSPDTKLESLTPEQRSAMLDAMERVEGYKQGEIQVLQEAFKELPTAVPTDQAQAGQAPQRTDVNIENLIGTPADRSAKVVPAPQGNAKTMVLSLGTNDFDDPKNTYQNTLDAINEGRRKGYNVVVVPPPGGNEKFKAAYDEVMKAVNQTGAPVEQPQAYETNGSSPTSDELKRIGEKYKGSVVVGDNVATGIGQYVENGQTIASENVRTDAILSKIKSEDIAKLETAQVTNAPATFDSSVFAQIDPRVKEWYDKASDSERRLLEAAITQKGVASINQTMDKFPKATATAAGETLMQEVGDINNVEYGDLGQRNNPVDPALMSKVSSMVTDIYGPEYKAVIYSAGEPTSGPKVSQSGRHDVKVDAEGNIIGGQAADIRIVHRETGEAVPRAQQVKAAQYWQAKGFGGIGLGMPNGGLHVDQVQRGEAKGPDLTYRAWAYGAGGASQTNLTEEERTALIQARSEEFDVSSITIPRPIEADTAQVVQTTTEQGLPGTEPVTQPSQMNPQTGSDVNIQPLVGANTATTSAVETAPTNMEVAQAMQTAEVAPPTAMKLGGEMGFNEPNNVNESMSLMSGGKEVAQFNKNEEVNVADGKINVQNEYQKKTNETQQKTEKGMPQTQSIGSMKTVPSTDVLRSIPEGYSPHSPSLSRAFSSIKSDRHWEKGLMS